VAAIERVLKPIVAAEERRAGAHLVRPGRAVQAHDQVGLRALNDAPRTAFDAPGSAEFERGSAPADAPPTAAPEPLIATNSSSSDSPQAGVVLAGALRFKQSPVRLHPGEDRGVSLVIDPAQVPPGARVEVTTDPGLRLKLWDDVVPPPNRGGWSRLTGTLRTRVSVKPGARLAVLAEAAGHSAELDVLIVRHRAGGWVSEIARKDEDAVIEAHFDPESGVVTVFEGRPEFKPSSAPPAGPASSRRACASTSRTACSKSRPPPTPSTPGRRSKSSRAASPPSWGCSRRTWSPATPGWSSPRSTRSPTRRRRWPICSATTPSASSPSPCRRLSALRGPMSSSSMTRDALFNLTKRQSCSRCAGALTPRRR
jgi:hypothetical protein